jgi:ArsR family transcriptional regulator
MDTKNNVLKAISNPVRLEILKFLCKQPCCVTLTNEQIKISQPNLSQHLKLMKDSGIIDSKKEKNKRCYFVVDSEKVKELILLLERLADASEDYLNSKEEEEQ